MAVLKQSIQAPPGHVVVAADSSQGEARLLGWQANQHDLTEAFRAGRDIYSEFASDVYGRTIDRKKNKDDYIEGQVGKISILSFGFGAGWYTAAMGFLKGVLGAPPIQFTDRHILAMQINPAKFLNSPKKLKRVNEMPSRLNMSDRLTHCIVADALVSRYRARYSAIAYGDRQAGVRGYWSEMEDVMTAMIAGREYVFAAHGVLATGKDCIHGPCGMKLNYRGIQRNSAGEFSYFDGRNRRKLYPTMVVENITQWLHRLVMAPQMLEISQTGIKCALWPYDEIVTVVPEEAAELTLQFMLQTLSTSPAWAKGLPLAAEGGVGKTYAEAK
jgi:DNA polymerase